MHHRGRSNVDGKYMRIGPSCSSRRLGVSAVKTNFVVAILLAAVTASAQTWQPMRKEGDLWVSTYDAQIPARPRVRINAHGAVTLQGHALQGPASKNIIVQVKIGVRARDAEQARRMLEGLGIVRQFVGDLLVLSTPGERAVSSVTMLAPGLDAADIQTSDGAVEAYDVDGRLVVRTGANLVKVDRIHGDCDLHSGGGDIQIGKVDGDARGTTIAGSIRADFVGGETYFKTNGGNIDAQKLGGKVYVDTGGGTVHVVYAAGPVTAINGGGPIVVDQSGGIVSAQNVAGSVRIGAAAGIQCQSANGGIQLNRITGPMMVTTSMGNILANLFGSHLAESLLATGNGDITVVVPSNVGVTIRAQNQMSDTLQRIRSDYRELQPRPRGTWLVAEGRLNGGGPLLQISAASGTIFIKRQ
jgi:hypothetical protein